MTLPPEKISTRTVLCDSQLVFNIDVKSLGLAELEGLVDSSNYMLPLST